jgi:LemA protein
MKKYIRTILIALVALSLSSCSYNSMVKNREAVTAQWANVESQYQRRADLIPNLVNTVKGYANFEQETLTKVIEARANATSVKLDPSNLSEEDIARFQQAQGQLSGALSRLLVTVERYPELKANQNFLELQAQLEGTENRIATERKRYNDIVQVYNSQIASFPALITARIFNFQAKGYFKADAGTERAPDVQF